MLTGNVYNDINKYMWIQVYQLEKWQLRRTTMHQPTNSTIPQGIFRQCLAKFILHMRRNCYLWALSQNS